MIQRSQCTRLAAEASQPIRVARELMRQGLDGNVAAKLAIVRAIHLAHTARTDRREDFINAESLAGAKRHDYQVYRASRRRWAKSRITRKPESGRHPISVQI